MVTIGDQRCGDAWIAAVQDDNQFWAKADELTSDIVRLSCKNAALPEYPMI